MESGKPAPWGHGDDLDLSRAPDTLAELVERVASDSDYKLGPCRDVTILHMSGGMFRMDPTPYKGGGAAVYFGMR